MKTNFKNKIKKIFRRMGWEISRYNALRPSMVFIKEHFENRQFVGVELGVWEGENAFSILKYMNIKKLYLVDPYEAYDEYEEYKDYGECDEGYSMAGLIQAKIDAKKKLNRFSEKIIWINKLSSEAKKEIPNDLDFVYIDANHSYKYVIEDMRNYYGKLKRGGVLAGHDVLRPEVIRAVIDFADEKNLQINIKNPDWWIVK